MKYENPNIMNDFRAISALSREIIERINNYAANEEVPTYLKSDLRKLVAELAAKLVPIHDALEIELMKARIAELEGRALT